MRSALFSAWFAAVVAAGPAMAASTEEATPKRGGTLTYMIPADAPPSLDGHREGTFAMLHATAPFYSVLVRVNPENPSDTTHLVCDLCTAIPTPADDGKTWTFKIRTDVKFHDGSPLTAADVAASWHEIIFPRPGVLSVRQNWWSVVDSVESPDPTTVVFRLKFATATFLPSLADPFAFIYPKAILDKDPRWFEQHVLGSGPFRFVSLDMGQSIKGERNPDYYHKGLPYLDGFVGIFADKQVVRVEAIHSGRAAMEFRGLPPAAINDLQRELGDKIKVQTHDWNCGNLITPNEKRKPFDDVRVRRALLLAVDQWNGAPALAKIANVHTVGGIVFPGSPLAATKEELQKLAGFWPDIEKSRAEARRLLKEAGQEGLHLELLNRNVDQPYKYVGTWLVDQWSKIGVTATQRVLPTGPWLQAMRTGRLRHRGRGQLQQRREPGAGHAEISAPRKVRGELRRFQRSGGGRYLREDAAGDRLRQATRADAAVRDARDRYRGARVSDAVVEPHDPRAVLCARVEDRSQPLYQPGSVQYLVG